MSSARRRGFSGPSGVTAVPRLIRLVRWEAAAMTVIGEVMPYCMWRLRSQALSKPRSSPRLIMSSVALMPVTGSAGSKVPMVRKPSFFSGRFGSLSGVREVMWVVSGQAAVFMGVTLRRCS